MKKQFLAYLNATGKVIVCSKIWICLLNMKSSFTKTDNYVFNNSQKSCFFIVHSNKTK